MRNNKPKNKEILIPQYILEIDRMEKPFLKTIKMHKYPEYVKTPKDVAKMMRSLTDIHKKAEEFVYIIGVNMAAKPTALFEIGHGAQSCCAFEQKNIITRMLLCGAKNFIIVHNHPSGNVEPSAEDIKSFKKLRQMCDVMDINMLDYIIIGGYDHYAYKENPKIDREM